MSLYNKVTTYLRDDPLIHRVLRSSGYLFSGNGIFRVVVKRRQTSAEKLIRHSRATAIGYDNSELDLCH